MFSKFFLALALFLYVSSSIAERGCGTPTFSEESKREMHERERAILSKKDLNLNGKRDTTWVAVNFHEIYWNAPYFPSQMATDLINAYNTAFFPTGVQFYLDSIDSINAQALNKPGWWNCTWGTTADREMRLTLRIGGSRNLNIYLCNLKDYAGQAQLPSSYPNFPQSDGVLELADYFDGTAPTNILDHAIHEVGHWMGLYHTFDGGCSDTFGDYVLDTPAEYEPHYYCYNTDSCPEQPGLDPIWNVMDYALYYCDTNLTAGQQTRMIEQFALYRTDQAVNKSSPVTTKPITTRRLTSGSTTGAYTTREMTTSTTCVGQNGYMRCSSPTEFQICSNGRWYNTPCQPGLYCNPSGNYIVCSYDNPSTATATSTTAAVTSGDASTTKPLTTSDITSGAVTSEALTTEPGLTTNPLTTSPLTTNTPPFTTSPVTSRALTTRALTTSSVSCSVGQTKCISGGTYQTCVYVQSSGGWTGGWGANQNCPAGTSCVQYSGYIGCS